MLFRVETRGELRVPDVETEAKGAADDLRHTFNSLAAHPNYVEFGRQPEALSHRLGWSCFSFQASSQSTHSFSDLEMKPRDSELFV